MRHPWSILGAGAIGSLLASQFIDSNIPVNIIPRSPGSDNTKQLSIIHAEKNHTTSVPIHASGNIIHQLLITTKSYQTKQAIEAIATDIADDVVVLVLQNGMGSTDWLQERLPNATILAGTTTHGAFRKDPNTIVHAGIGQTWIGPLLPGDEAKAKAIYESWKNNKFSVEWDSKIEQRLWLKLAINCAINPLTVIYDCKNGELLEKPEAIADMEKIVAEFNLIYEKRFHSRPKVDVLDTVFDVCKKTAANISSMRQDVLNQRHTEIEAITGYLLNQASTYGIACEHNRSVYDKIIEITS